jgi:phosphoesterase family protein
VLTCRTVCYRSAAYYDGTDVPVYDHLAEEFAVCDRWFASVPGSTLPNRLYALCGTAAGSRDDRPLHVRNARTEKARTSIGRAIGLSVRGRSRLISGMGRDLLSSWSATVRFRSPVLQLALLHGTGNTGWPSR